MEAENKRHRSDRYVSPLERLRRRNRAWQPKKVALEEELEEACRRGGLEPFEQPTDFYVYFIHRKTDPQLLDKLIEEAKQVNEFSMDTEDDCLSHRPATIQVEFIRPNLPPIIIIVEAKYLPDETTPLHSKIQRLCSQIFTTGNRVYSWGAAKKELDKFKAFGLFDEALHMIEHNIQAEFGEWYGYDGNHSPGKPYSLQFAIKESLKQHLDKTATLAEWGCGVDLALGTYISQATNSRERSYQTREEGKYRSILRKYAVNDVFAVTKLVHLINQANVLTPPATIELKTIDRNDEHLDQEQEDDFVELHASPEDWSLVHVENEPDIYGRPNQQRHLVPEQDYVNEPSTVHVNQVSEGTTDFHRLDQTDHQTDRTTDYDRRSNLLSGTQNEYITHRTVHVWNEPMDIDVDDDLESIPEIMKVHFDRPSYDQPLRSTTVHVRNEPKQVTNRSRLDHHETSTPQRTAQQIKNRIANERRRAKRYRHEVIRRLYQRFTVTQCKQILKAMDIQYVNVNIVGHTLFIGMKDQESTDEAEGLLHRRIFTESHYCRLYQRKEERK